MIVITFAAKELRNIIRTMNLFFLEKEVETIMYHDFYFNLKSIIIIYIL